METFFQENQSKIEAFHSGKCHDAYTFLGAHPKDGGVSFSVWAPHAERVSVCGDFNGWDGTNHVMRQENGIWQLFVPGIGAGEVYKYEIRSGGTVFFKADPFAFYSQLRPDTGSVVTDLSYAWQDGAFLENKAQRNAADGPVNIYEVHLGSFMTKEDGSYYSYSEIAPKLINYLLEMGYNYVEFMPLLEYPLDASWGYQIVGFFSLTSRYGTPQQFCEMVDALHNAGIGVIMDWVPGHFCRDAHGLFRFDGTPLYEYQEQIKADNPGWGTANFDFTKPEVRSFLLSSAIFWMQTYHMDGLRVDAVANMLYSNFGKPDDPRLRNRYGGFENIEAISFIRLFNQTVKTLFPHNITCAEDSSDWPHVTGPTDIGGLGFTFKWNMGWMNDSLDYMKLDPIYKKYHHDKLTFPLFYAFSEQFILPISHDEVVHGKCSLLEKMPGYRQDKLDQVKDYLCYMMGMPGKKLLFMGCEFASPLEWRFYESLEWNLLTFPEYTGVKRAVADINHIYLKEPALWYDNRGWESFSWCDAKDNSRSVLSFVRRGKTEQDLLVFVCNFTPMLYEAFQVGVPRFVDYIELYNTDHVLYGGKNRLNRGMILPKTEGCGEMPFSVQITLPPFAAIILKPFGGGQDMIR